MAENAQRILVIDDDERLHERVRDFLELKGFECRKSTGGEGVLADLATFRPDLVLLDVMMPGEDGFAVLMKIRDVSKVPVIMLTARGEDTDRIIGLELGADDYLPKPFNPRELLARIRAVLRRADGQGEPEKVEPAPIVVEETASAMDIAFATGVLRKGAYVLDTKRQTLSFGDNTKALSTAELCLLHAFMTHAGAVLAREQLMVLAFGSDEHSTARSIDVHISRLRALLRELGETSTRIRTVWGSGYCWIEE
ncbi:response regulator transcription factor [Desulfovibrio sp. OttesenSCG-928-O18]|nr:response regulator transcription factor [Desulfovibrio sp. OttesenSCG-928-O18]